MSNHLKNQVSPYLLQHADNPVNWYPWCDEAFVKARRENKPIFLSIGYSTCHWCHVMAHESFEDEETAEILNKNFIAIKVDKEERPDIDSIYMAVCQAFTGSGGWPMSIFMTPEQKPFFAGTYFPLQRRFNTISFKELLVLIKEKWDSEKDMLLNSANETVASLGENVTVHKDIDADIINSAVSLYKRSYDKVYGGFGDAPKFPSPHNLLFLLTYYEKNGDTDSLEMVKKTLLQMYRGGIFDHIGYGFSRYSTDRIFLAPHFEKMLYDNAMLVMAYCKTYEITGDLLYKEIAEKTASYIIEEMTSKEGGFYSAQDADSEGEEGKYYLFRPLEVIDILGETKGAEFNTHYDISENGNFEGKNIPNLLNADIYDKSFEKYLTKIYEYRKNRYKLHLDDKILTSWNCLMIIAMCQLYRISKDIKYLNAAEKAHNFIKENLSNKDTLFVSYREARHGAKGFLEDYANYIAALLSLYDAALEKEYLERAYVLCKKVIADFWDEENFGFYLYGSENEALIIRPKETYDGAVPSANSIMAHNLIRLNLLLEDEEIKQVKENHLKFLYTKAKDYPIGHGMFLTAFCDYLEPPIFITIVQQKDNLQQIKEIPLNIPLNTIIKILPNPTKEYPLINNKTTYYMCKNHTCTPPTNVIPNIHEDTKIDKQFERDNILAIKNQ